ncbi:MAG: hypothetical protein NVSMB51_03600 [Solirubrobacteraceae bacterium]
MSSPERARLRTLHETGLLDSDREETFDRFTRLAGRLLGAPVSLVSLIDSDRQFFKSQIGLAEPWASARQTPLSHSFCRHVVAGGAPLIVSDAREDPQLRDNPAITDLNVIAYAGVPLRTADGQTLGSFCAIDSRPRNWSANDLTTLEDIAAAAMSEIELRLAARRAAVERDFSDAVMNAAGSLVLVLDESGEIVRYNGACSTLTGYSAAEMIGLPVWQRLVPEEHVAAVRRSFAERRPVPPEHTGHWCTRAGEKRLIAWHSRTIGAGTKAPHFVVSTGIDITDRAAAEERFRAAFDGAPNGMALVGLLADQRGRLLRVNEALCEITGYGRARLERLGFDALTDARSAPASHALIAQLAQGAIESGTLDSPFAHADGHPVWVSINASLMRDPGGAPEYAIAQIDDITERRRMERNLAHMADHDPLTDLLNRRGLHARVEQIAAAARTAATSGVVAVVDLDNFKPVNDSYGHAVGDELIVACAEAMRSVTSVIDDAALARLGGDEFALVLPDCDEQRALALAEQLLEALRSVEVEVDGHAVSITASVGLAMIDAKSTDSPDELLVAADLAMIAAKEEGRDRLAIAEAEGAARAQARLHQTWVERIREALAADRLELLAQPIAELDGGRVARHELLLRMRGDQGELISPASFVHVAERFGQIQAIDRWAVARAIQTLARLPADSSLQVNISGASVTDAGLADFVTAEIGNAGIDGARLTFEITETVAIAHMDRARKFALRIGELGCTLALDDFGSGFGSFLYIKRLPFHFIKIDGEFVADLPRSPDDQVMVKAIAEIISGLGKRSIAEYVSDQETVDLLRDYGVHYAQGDFIGRPGPLKQQIR